MSRLETGRASGATGVSDDEEGLLSMVRKGSAVAVTAGKPTEFKFTLSKKTVAKGVTTFRVTNKGTIRHDFRIGGKKTVALATGKTASFAVTFKKAGKYAYLCTLPGHAAGGMKGTFTVR